MNCWPETEKAMLNRHLTRLIAIGLLLTIGMLDCHRARSADTADGRSAERPVVEWRFEEDTNPEVPGPRPPLYPGFPSTNRARFFSGEAPWLTRPDAATAAESTDRVGPGESVTLEAWVRVQSLGEGQLAYIVGKGRSLKFPGADKNQNYALRIKGQGQQALVSFLFASQAEANKASDWHRWTSRSGFALGGGWHHIAVSYTFGKPANIRGFVDGRAVDGEWDMGGATTRPPVNDHDELAVGTGNGGGSGNVFRGWLDDVRVWKRTVPDTELIARFEYAQPAPRVERRQLTAGKILVELCAEGVPEANAWPIESPTTTERWWDETFAWFELPQSYVSTGVRADRAIPLLMRASSVMPIPRGKHRLLLRGRGAARLYIDEKLVLTTPFPPNSSDGHHPIPKDYLNLGPDFRFAPPGNREVWCEWTSDGGERVIVLETMVGSLTGKAKRRPELGETVVAISYEGQDSWQLLGHGAKPISYTDAGWASFEATERVRIAEINAARRAACRQEHAAYWHQRREAASSWLRATVETPVPPLPDGFPATNPIDHFLAEKIAAARAEAQRTKPGPIDFYRDIQPILTARCTTCHTGEQAASGLRLDAPLAAQHAGDSGRTTIQPGRAQDSELFQRIASQDANERMPPTGEPLTAEQVVLLKRWIDLGAPWPSVPLEYLDFTPPVSDDAFLRRLSLDTVGVIPTADELREFRRDSRPHKRAIWIDRRLADARWSDAWMGYWQDLLAENPNILNPTLNNTGPFRWWLQESLLDNKPLDLMITELIRMEGSKRFGGPAGFGEASQNDVPLAAKGTILSAALLGVELKCARCHDSPYHSWKQRDLFSLAAMMARTDLEVTKSSSVPLDKLHAGGRQPLIAVTLAPGTKVKPGWPFPELIAQNIADHLAEHPQDTRERLAALITAPENERFAQVMANRIWRRFFGRGLVEPVDDWQRGRNLHPELVRWLGRELVRSGYDVKHLARLMLNSHAYQRQQDSRQSITHPLFAAPAPRRLSAEQLVDSLFAAVEKSFDTEEISLDIDSQRDLGNSISLGRPTRAWMFASTSNERDRPSLSLPRVQAVVDVLEAFGWRASRADPLTARDESVHILQPAVLANSPVSIWLTRLDDHHAFTRFALGDRLTLDELIDELFERILNRSPTATERARYRDHLEPGFARRVADLSAAVANESQPRRQPPRYVSWSNHLTEEANEVKVELESAARRGSPPTRMLQAEWRERLEDAIWALLNAPEWIYLP
jgi:hypothetical protein